MVIFISNFQLEATVGYIVILYNGPLVTFGGDAGGQEGDHGVQDRVSVHLAGGPENKKTDQGIYGITEYEDPGLESEGDRGVQVL